MIIQLSSTLSILSHVSHHGDPKTIDIPRFILADDHIPDIVVSADTEPGWSQSGFPAQFLGIGGKSLSWMGHGNCMSLLLQVMKSCGVGLGIMFLS